MLIPELERDIEYTGQSMSNFEFLKRCSREECDTVRTLLEDWFSHYPESDSDDLKGRFQSGDEDQFRSSFWELYLHALLLRLGYAVEVHPNLDTDPETKPDFLANSSKNPEVIIEAVSPQMDTEEPPGATRCKETFIDQINAHSHPGFGLRLEEKTTPRNWPEEQPSSNRVWANVKQWLNGLDYIDLRALWEENGLQAMPARKFNLKGWDVTFTAIPKPEEQRGSKRGHIIRMQHSGGQLIDSSTPIKEAIRDKATRYGDLERPYVVAVNITDPMVEEIDIMDALFEKEVPHYSVEDEGDTRFETGRKPKGAWVEADAETNTVSAVLIGTDVKPWRVAVTPVVFCHNPWTQRRVEGPIANLPAYKIEGETYQRSGGVHPRSVFELPSDWPYSAA